MQFNYWRDNELQIAILQKKTTPMIKKWKLEIQKRNKNIRFKLLEGGGGGYLKFERYFDYHRNLLQISWRVLSCRWTRSYYGYSFILFFLFSDYFKQVNIISFLLINNLKKEKEKKKKNNK